MCENTVCCMLYFGESNKKQMLVKNPVNKNTSSYMQRLVLTLVATFNVLLEPS